MQEQTTRQTFGVGIKTLKFTGETLQSVARWLLHNRNKVPHGRQTLKNLTRQNGKLTAMDLSLSGKDKLQFEKISDKYHVDYSVMKSPDSDMHIVFFKAKDVDLMNAALQEFTKVKLEPPKPSIKKRLEQIKTKQKQQPQNDRDNIIDFSKHKKLERDR